MNLSAAASFLLSQNTKKACKPGSWKPCEAHLQTNELAFVNKENKIKYRAFLSEIDASISIQGKLIQLTEPKSSPVYLMFKDKNETKKWFDALTKIRKYQHICQIGSGSFSQVELVEIEGKLIALKTITKTLIHNQNSYVLSERNALIECKHPFIIGFVFCYQTSCAFHFGLEFLHGGDLYNLIHKVELSQKEKRLILAEILIALSFVHSKGYLYRDMKLENILISENGSIKLTDFGLATKQPLANEMCGTLTSMPPEMVSGASYSFSADYWSFGVLAFVILFGKFPFDDKSNYTLQQNIQKSQPAFPDEVDPIEKEFVQSFFGEESESKS